MRKALSKKTRFDVFKRDQFACQYCGSTPPKVVLEVDHIVSVKDGGGDDQTNLITACYDCNRGKSANSLTIVPIGLPDQMAEMAEREAQIASYNRLLRSKKRRAEKDCWRIANEFLKAIGHTENEIRKSYFTSIKTFVDRLGVEAVSTCLEIAIANNGAYSSDRLFRYFCGVCWNTIKRPQVLPNAQ